MKVVNLKKEPYTVYIGRDSIFGNPFSIGKDGSRTEVINKFKQYFYNRINNDDKFREKVITLSGKTLGCFCKPLGCHGDIIIEYLEKYHKNDKRIG